jgi:hypothetical protein
MKYPFLTLALLCACHGFATPPQQGQTPTSATPLIQKSTPKPSTSILVALAHGVFPTDALKTRFYQAIGQQQ